MVDKKIFSGENSRSLWDEINAAKTVMKLNLALYTVCCRLQVLEEKVDRKKDRTKTERRSDGTVKRSD